MEQLPPRADDWLAATIRTLPLTVDDEDESGDIDDADLPAEFLRTDDTSALRAAAILSELYDRVFYACLELERLERALRLAEPRCVAAQQARAWVRTALAGLHYPVFRGLDEARTLLRPPRQTSTHHAAVTTADAADARQHGTRLARLLSRARAHWSEPTAVHWLLLRLKLWRYPLDHHAKASLCASIFLSERAHPDTKAVPDWLAQHVGYHRREAEKADLLQTSHRQ
ncbi:MAG: hypothetical protein ACRDQ5_02090 [Sciscionella sp.]